MSGLTPPPPSIELAGEIKNLPTAAPAPPPPPTETEKKTAGQRRVNLMWELTQSLVAISVTAANIYCAVSGIESDLLGNAFVMILAMYFIRTNHTKIGGVGTSEDSR